MKARLVALAAGALLLANAAAPPARVRGGGLTLTSSRIALPDETIASADDPDGQLVQGNCLGCHSAEMIALQPKLDAAHWAAEVEKMRAVYKAPVSDEDARRLPAILARQPGPR